ncbi:hypothetical protein THAOC_23110 [Thalassiosira oceanica]|uniref:Uncharacterized protein n=1 Tax=Thalassiosira oceanica TaxID=159749 RepID=K0RSU3_THAOC|nr:hypothetical protein THAOC_23110 [Thalassiosira oceanica]|eukprot:EJK56908.1 hypothetical protein THAOC_23110 [Thalassiosira oceanica]
MLKVGTAVTIRGLASESSRVHNGRAGVVTSVPYGSGGRYNVRVDGVENTLAVRPENLVPSSSAAGSSPARRAGRRVSFSDDFRVGSTVRISGLKFASEHNGKLATVASLTDARTGRVKVSVEGLGLDLAVKPCNLTHADAAPEPSRELVEFYGDDGGEDGKGGGDVPWHRRHRAVLLIVLATVVASAIVVGVVAGVSGRRRRSAAGSAGSECPAATGCTTADGDGRGYGAVDAVGGPRDDASGGNPGGGEEGPASSWYGPDGDEEEVEYLAEDVELKSFLTFHLGSFGLDDALSDPTGPSYRAYLWLANSDNLDGLSDFRRMQRFGMAALYYGTTSPGSGWAASTHWATDRSECDWYGVSCVRMGSAGSDGIIREISLPGNGLTGSIPPGAVLAGVGGRLAGLDLSGNAVGGTVPEALGVFANLSVLDLRDNDFTGRIPESLGRLKNLEYLYVDGNAITGRMPDGVCSLVEDGVLNPVAADCAASGGLECDPDCCECV